MKKMDSILTDAAFIVLALLAEKQTHGYDLEQLVHTRGFRYWTEIQRSSIYLALKHLEEKGFISAKIEQGGGPPKKVYRITDSGRIKLESDTVKHLSLPSHPRNEIDLGIYALPFLSPKVSQNAIHAGLLHLQERESFLKERLKWCREHDLELPALAFERPLLALQADIIWLKKFSEKVKSIGAKAIPDHDWKNYLFKEPPSNA